MKASKKKTYMAPGGQPTSGGGGGWWDAPLEDEASNLRRSNCQGAFHRNRNRNRRRGMSCRVMPHTNKNERKKICGLKQGRRGLFFLWGKAHFLWSTFLFLGVNNMNNFRDFFLGRNLIETCFVRFGPQVFPCFWGVVVWPRKPHSESH